MNNYLEYKKLEFIHCAIQDVLKKQPERCCFTNHLRKTQAKQKS